MKYAKLQDSKQKKTQFFVQCFVMNHCRIIVKSTISLSKFKRYFKSIQLLNNEEKKREQQ